MLTKEKKLYNKKEHHPTMPRYHTKQNENCMYYTINRNLGKILSLFTCSEVLSSPSHLPAFTTSPLSHGCPTAPPPPPPKLQLSLPLPFSPPPSFTTARVTVSPTLPKTTMPLPLLPPSWLPTIILPSRPPSFTN